MVDSNRSLCRIPGVRKVLYSNGTKEIGTSRKSHSFIAYTIYCMLSLFECIKNCKANELGKLLIVNDRRSLIPYGNP